MTSHHDPASYHPVYSGMLVPNTPADFDFGRVIDKSLSDRPALLGERGQTSQWFYDIGVQAWLTQVFQLDGHTVPIVMSPPQNALSAYRKILVGLGRMKECTDCDKPDITTPPLPMVSVSCGAPKPRGGSQPFPIRHVRFIDDELANVATKKYGTTYSRYPKPVLLPYKITLWAHHKSHFHWLAQRFMETFWDYLAYFRVETPYLAKADGLLAAAKIIGQDDVSELERGTDERLLRYDFTVDVEAWIFYDSLRAPTVHSVSQEVLAKGPGEPDEMAESVFIDTEDLTGDAKVPLHLQPPPSEPMTDGVTQ